MLSGFSAASPLGWLEEAEAPPAPSCITGHFAGPRAELAEAIGGAEDDDDIGHAAGGRRDAAVADEEGTGGWSGGSWGSSNDARGGTTAADAPIDHFMAAVAFSVLAMGVWTSRSKCCSALCSSPMTCTRGP